METLFAFRFATIDDASQILAIYKPYVLNSAISFEYKVPSINDIQNKITKISKNYPFIVCCDYKTGKILGYAYGSEFRWKKAFQYACESSVYVDSKCQARGVGTALYNVLLDILTIQHFTTVVAVVTAEQGKRDASQSSKFHEKMGFYLAVTVPYAGRKFNKWYDIQMYLKHINATRTEKNQIIAANPLVNINDLNIREQVDDIFDKYSCYSLKTVRSKL